MSKIKALITTLIIGTSSVAMADSSVTFHANAHASWGTPTVAPIIRDHQKPARVRGTWVSLAEPMNLARGRGFIDLQSRMPLNQIRLQSTSGQAFISTITVQYTNGASQVVTLNQWIDARNPLAQFNLNRTAQVDSILIKGSRAMRSGKFQVFGYASSTRPEQPPVYQPPVYQRIVPLANSMTLAQSRGSKEILVAANAGSFSKLRITGATGASPLSHILVSFTNGREQLIRVDRTLNGGDTVDLDLDIAGRGSIARLVVYQSYNTGWIRGTVGTFNVAAL